MKSSRRSFLQSSAAVSAGFLGLHQFLQPGIAAGKNQSHAGYGPLVPDAKKILDLPQGFQYRVISRVGEKMADGFLVPGLPDGMAAFPGRNGQMILVRNHELTPDQRGPFGRKNHLIANIDRGKLYDHGRDETPGLGGTTTLVFDTRRQKVVRQFLSLAGTHRNCAGGPTLWNSWITCEETTMRRGRDEKLKFWADEDHGYNFEVPARDTPHLADPVPLKAMGRFRHEAVAFNPKSGIVSQTEDRDDGALYRFIPNVKGKLIAGGRLQALKISAVPKADTRNWNKGESPFTVGKSMPVEWIDLDDVESPKDDLRFRAFSAGAAKFARGEGMWYGHDSIYFACTSGGKKELGQLWRYRPGSEEGTAAEQKNPGRLELFIEPNDSNLIKNADNLTVAPWGDLIVCEDRPKDQVRLIGVTPQGRIYTFADNHLHSEFAGAVFSPDGTTLFVNIQKEGLTLAITGPWTRTSKNQ